MYSFVINFCFFSIRYYHRIFNPANMNCIMPCDLRSNSSNIVMGNHLSHLCIELPMNVEGNIPILWSFNETIKNIKENGDHATMYLFTHITYLLFPFCIGMFENNQQLFDKVILVIFS